MSRKIRGRELLEEVRNWSMDKAREITSHGDEYEFGAVNVGKTRVLLEVEGYISDLIEREDERGVLGWMDTVSLDDLILEDSEDLEITVDGSELMSWGRDEGKRYIYVRLRMDESDYRYNYIMKMKDDNRIESFDFDKMGSREFGVICICNESELMKMMREVNENVEWIETFDITRMVNEMKERDGSYYDVWKKLVGWRCDEGKR